jgi:hypothetical protein
MRHSGLAALLVLARCHPRGGAAGAVCNARPPPSVNVQRLPVDLRSHPARAASVRRARRAHPASTSATHRRLRHGLRASNSSIRRPTTSAWAPFLTARPTHQQMLEGHDAAGVPGSGGRLQRADAMAPEQEKVSLRPAALKVFGPEACATLRRLRLLLVTCCGARSSASSLEPTPVAERTSRLRAFRRGAHDIDVQDDRRRHGGDGDLVLAGPGDGRL